MNVLVIYDSAYGNTEKIAKAIARVVTKPHEAKLLLVGETVPVDLRPIDLLVVGSPTQGGRPTKALRHYIDSFSPNALSGVRVAAFDTRFANADHGFSLRLLMKTIGFASPRIAASLRAKGGEMAAEPEGFYVNDKEGPLKPGELERASAWIKKIIKSSTGK